jgi:hypothetical protein
MLLPNFNEGDDNIFLGILSSLKFSNFIFSFHFMFIHSFIHFFISFFFMRFFISFFFISFIQLIQHYTLIFSK